MRKLKTLFVLLFAVCLSLTLFACGGGGDGDKDNDKDDDDQQQGSEDPDELRIQRVTIRGGSIALTDMSTESDLTDAINKLTLVVTYTSGTSANITGADCTVTHNVVFGTVDSSYTATLTPSKDNAGNVSANVTVSVDHAWKEQDGKFVCEKDGATKTSYQEDVVIHYGTFHDGTASTNATAIKNAAVTADEAAALGLKGAEVSNGQVFNSAAGITGNQSSGQIKALGRDESYEDGAGTYGAEIPSLTAGQLEPGMSITITGFAKTDITAGDYDPWGHANEYYNAPSFGIADRYAKTSTWTNGGAYMGGNSVIVRSEGWVLYNGIGSPRLLAGLPRFVEGIAAAKSGEVATANYGSHSSDTGTHPTGFDANKIPEPTSADWKDWWVYSTGNTTNSGDQYGAYTAITVTWTYRTYKVGESEVGVIEIVRTVGSNTLTSRIKVPAASRGYYDTIIHGDYSSMIITSTTVVETETTTGMTVNGIKAGAQATYLAGQTIDAGATVDVSITTAQNPTQPRMYTISNDMLFYYTGENDVNAAKADIEDAEKWVAVGNEPLTTAMKIFKVEFSRSGQTFRGLVLNNGESAISVVENNIKAVYGYDYNETLKNNKKTGAYALSINGENAQLTLAGGVAQAIPADSGFTGTDETYRYFVAKIEGIAAFGELTDVTTTASNVKILAKKEGDDVLIAFAITKDALGQTITVEGIQEKDIEFVFGNDIIGFDVTSTSDPQVNTNWKLDEGGKVTITYSVEDIATFYVYFGDRSASRPANGLKSATEESPIQLGTTGVQVLGYKTESGKATLTLQFNEFAFGATEMPRIEAVKDGKTVAIDYINYGFEFSENCETVQDGYYFYVEGGKLYIVKPVAATNGEVDFDSASVRGNLKVTANQGDLETAKQLDLSFSGNHGVVSFNNTTLNDVVREVEGGEDVYVYTIGQTLFTSSEGDEGAFITIEIDMQGAFGFEGEYGIEVNPSSESEAYWWYDGTKLERVEIPENATYEIVKEGSCLTPATVAYKIVEGGETKYYAAYQEVGGEHDFDEDGICTKCGATRSEVVSDGAFTWYGTSATSSIAEGEVVEGRGTFKDSTSTFGKNGIGILVWENNNQALFQIAGIGDVLYSGTASDIWNTRVEPYDETAFPNGSDRVTSSNITEEHPYNTLNGVLDKDGVGVEIDNLATILAGGGFRYIVEHRGELIVATLNFYIEGQKFSDKPQFTMTATFTTKAGATYDVWFMGGDGNNCVLDGNKIELIKSKASNSAIGTVEAATVGEHAASENVTFATAGSTITATGMAAKTGNNYYLAFKVSFTKALSATTIATVKNGDAILAGATATFNQSYDELEVYIPLTAGSVPEALTIDLTNFEASTLQADITLDLTKVICSDVTATVTGADALTIAEGEFTIAYEGNVQSTDAIVVGEVSKALSELTGKTKDTAVALANGLSAYITEATVGTTVTVHFVKAAADLTKTITGADIVLKRGTQSLALNSIAPAIAIPEDTQQIEATGWYAQASGTTLTIVATADSNKAPSALPFNVNAGHVTDVEHLGIYDLAFKVENGAVVFENATNYLAKATTAAYTEYNGKFIVALTFDLTKFEIAEATPYGFAIENEGAEKYYTVDAQRAITEAAIATATKLDIATADPCHNDTVKGYGNGTSKDDATFYYGLEVRPAGHAFPEQGGACTVCSEVTGWVKENIVVGKADQWSNAAADGYDPADTEKFGAIVKGQKAVFEGTIKTATASISGSWLNMHGPLFKIGGLTIRSDGFVDTLGSGEGDYAANKWHVNTVESVKYDGTAYSGSKIPWGDAVVCRGNAAATITYDWTNDTEIVFTFFSQSVDHNFEIVGKITSTVEGGEFEKDIYEIGLLPFYCYFTGTLTVTGDATKVPAADCNPYIRDPGTKLPDPTYTQDSEITKEGGMTMGTEGTAGDNTQGWTGYSNTPNWIGKLEKGKKIVITGTQKASADQPYWSSLTFFVWSTEVSTMPTNPTNAAGNDPGICMNHANGGAGHDEAFAITRDNPALTGGTDFAALIKEVGADCKVTIIFDWTQYNKQFSVTMKLENNDATKSVEVTYTFTEKDSATLAAYYNIGIGVDHSYATLTTITRTDGTPSQDLPTVAAHDHAYVNGLCTTCGGVQPASAVTEGEAVTSATWTASGFQVNQWNIQNFKKGAQVTVYGTQTTALAANWSTLNFEFNTGTTSNSVTMRTDNYGWYFDNSDSNAHVLEDSRKEMYIKTSDGTRRDNSWGEDYKAIMKQCDWRVDFNWTGDEVVITLAMTCTADGMYKDYTYYMVYTLDASAATTATLQFGSDASTISVLRKVTTGMD